MILDTTNRSLQVVLQAASTSQPMRIVASWTDMSTATTVSGVTPTVTNGTTAVTVVAAPAASTQRNVYALTIYNQDSASGVITVRLNDNGTAYTLVSVPLLPGETLSYSDVDAWQVLSATGLVKVSNTTVFSVATTIAGLVSKTANFTFSLNEAGYLAVCTSTSAIAATLPDNTTVAFPIGTFLFVMQGSSGVVTLTAGSGVTLQVGDTASTDGIYRYRAAIKIDTNTWSVF